MHARHLCKKERWTDEEMQHDKKRQSKTLAGRAIVGVALYQAVRPDGSQWWQGG